MIAILGWILAFVGAIWLIVTAIQTGKDTTDKIIWALVNFLCQPLGGIVFYFVKKQGMIPLLLVIIGWVLLVVGGGMNAFTNMAPR
jgi:hypothetical protein